MANPSRTASPARPSKLNLETPKEPPRFRVQLISGTGMLAFVAIVAAVFFGGKALTDRKACLANILLLEHRMAQGYQGQDMAGFQSAVESSGILSAYKCPDRLGGYSLVSASATNPREYTAYGVRCKVHGTAEELRKSLGDESFRQVLGKVLISKEVREQKGLSADGGQEN